jgi:hypothetical protein
MKHKLQTVVEAKIEEIIDGSFMSKLDRDDEVYDNVKNRKIFKVKQARKGFIDES